MGHAGEKPTGSRSTRTVSVNFSQYSQHAGDYIDGRLNRNFEPATLFSVSLDVRLQNFADVLEWNEHQGQNCESDCLFAVPS